MPKHLTQGEDVANTQKNFEKVNRLLKFDLNTKTPIYLLDDAYEEGYVHWVKLPDGTKRRVVCGGGLEGKGFDPANCKVCAALTEAYKEARTLEASDTKAGEALRKNTNEMRAKYSAEFVAVKGELLVQKDPKTKKKTAYPDFDEAIVGVLALSQAQFDAFVNLKGSEAYPAIKTYGDLANRVILVEKKKLIRNGKEDRFPTTSFIPSDKISDKPDVEYDADEFNITESFTVDYDLITEVCNLLSCNVVEDDSENDLVITDNESVSSTPIVGDVKEEDVLDPLDDISF